jgi:serine/threonine-protein kinase HipA
MDAFLWGLLPDNEQTLRQWGQRFQVSHRNAFALISHVGEDCAGAVQFVRLERVEALQSTPDLEAEWLDERGVAERLRALRLNHASWRLPRDHGQFSLAGAQPKTALLRYRGRWGVPAGRTPTTHILKPPAGEFENMAENEHLLRADLPSSFPGNRVCNMSGV